MSDENIERMRELTRSVEERNKRIHGTSSEGKRVETYEAQCTGCYRRFPNESGTGTYCPRCSQSEIERLASEIERLQEVLAEIERGESKVGSTYSANALRNIARTALRSDE